MMGKRVLYQLTEDRTRTREIEEQKRKMTIDQAPEDKRRTDIIEELKRKPKIEKSLNTKLKASRRPK
jgi:hypothetical protein